MRLELRLMVLLFAFIVDSSWVPAWCAEQTPQVNSDVMKTLIPKVEDLVRRFYPKAKISKTDKSIHFEYKTRMYDIPSTNTVEPGPEWGGVLGDISLKPGKLRQEDTIEKKLNQYSFYSVMELKENCATGDCHLEARLGHAFDVQPEFLQTYKSLIRHFDEPKTEAQ